MAKYQVYRQVIEITSVIAESKVEANLIAHNTFPDVEDIESFKILSSRTIKVGE